MSKLISEETKYEGPRFNVVQRIYEDDKTQKQYIRDSVELLPAAMILPITKNNEVVFIKQFREVLGKETLELPAGIIEAGEEPIVAAKRELEEETGFVAKEAKEIDTFMSSIGTENSVIHLVYIDNAKKEKDQNLDSDEYINYELFTFDELTYLFDTHVIMGGGNRLGYFHLKELRNK